MQSDVHKGTEIHDIAHSSLQFFSNLQIFQFLDQIIISASLADTTAAMHLVPGSPRIFAPSFLLTPDKTWRGERPFRSYYGFKYEGGFSDHLPLVVDFLLSE